MMVGWKGGQVIRLVCPSPGIMFIASGSHSWFLTIITFINIVIAYVAFRIIDAQNRRARAINRELDELRLRLVHRRCRATLARY